MIDAHLIMHDGERSEVLLFIPPTEDVVRLISEGAAFVAVARHGQECLVARDAIACLGVAVVYGPTLDEDLPQQKQLALVKLRSGVTLEGELRWIAPPGMQRTTDYLNGDGRYIALHTADRTFVIAKPHVAMVIEK